MLKIVPTHKKLTIYAQMAHEVYQHHRSRLDSILIYSHSTPVTTNEEEKILSEILFRA
jgi:esterase/lipase